MEDRQMDARKAGIGIAAMGLLLAGLGLAARPAAVPRDPDKVYQSGSAVGNVIGAKEDKARGVVYFQQIATRGQFDQFQDFEYRGYVLHIADKDEVGSTWMAGQTFENFIHVTSRIARNRS
jgi:hypothetical protein